MIEIVQRLLTASCSFKTFLVYRKRIKKLRLSNVCEVNIDGMNKTRQSRESKQFSVIKDSGNSERWGNVSTNEIAIVGVSLEDVILE